MSFFSHYPVSLSRQFHKRRRAGWDTLPVLWSRAPDGEGQGMGS